MAATLAFTEAWRSFMASVLAFMAAVMVAREALRSLVQGEADGGLVVVVAAASVGVVAAGAEESRTARGRPEEGADKTRVEAGGADVREDGQRTGTTRRRGLARTAGGGRWRWMVVGIGGMWCGGGGGW